MIVIDELADAKLTQRLEALKNESDLTKCIYFHLMGKTLTGELKDQIIK